MYIIEIYLIFSIYSWDFFTRVIIIPSSPIDNVNNYISLSSKNTTPKHTDKYEDANNNIGSINVRSINNYHSNQYMSLGKSEHPRNEYTHDHDKKFTQLKKKRKKGKIRDSIHKFVLFNEMTFSSQFQMNFIYNKYISFFINECLKKYLILNFTKIYKKTLYCKKYSL